MSGAEEAPEAGGNSAQGGEGPEAGGDGADDAGAAGGGLATGSGAGGPRTTGRPWGSRGSPAALKARGGPREQQDRHPAARGAPSQPVSVIGPAIETDTRQCYLKH